MLLLINGPLKLVQTVTSFTIAHSLTLASAVLGIANFPSAPIELLIAVSIVFLARESLLKDRTKTTLTQKSPWIVAFVFGLLHGFGFAGALGDLGLRDSDIPPALLFFQCWSRNRTTSIYFCIAGLVLDYKTGISCSCTE